MNIQLLSNRYTVRNLLPADAEMVYDVLKNNTIFYKYHSPILVMERKLYESHTYRL